MLRDKIEEFELKHKVDFNELLLAFERGASRADLSEMFNITELPLRKFIYSLGLDFVKSRRQDSIKQFHYMLGRENGEDPDIITELNKELTAVSKENAKLHKAMVNIKDSNTALRRQVREVARSELVLDNLLEYLNKHLIEYDVKTKVINIKGTQPVEQIEEGLCVVFSDEHLGEVVNPDKVEGNAYNYKIAEARILEVVKQVLLFPRQSNNINVMMLLDSLKGLIHDGLYSNEEGFTTAILKLVQLYTGVFKTFSQYYQEVNVHITLDNHSRITEKPATKNKQDNFSVLAVKMIQMLLETDGIKNVYFNFSKGDYNYTEINGVGVIMFHGDTVRQYKPYSTTQVAKVQDICLHTFGKPAKHFVSGHQHISMIIANQYGGTNIQNGTVVGHTEYGDSNGYLPISSNQTIFFINKRGVIEDTKVVSLQHITKI